LVVAVADWVGIKKLGSGKCLKASKSRGSTAN
jgi:hypothetical protein